MRKYKNIFPRLTLVGAGPGDADLITIKGVNAIAEADVILYDALVNTDLLKYASQNAIKIFVGKRAGNHSYTQDQINNMIVEYAFSYGHVVRLKGGDPFVFGRGHEELSYAEIFNIKVDIIPGISSAAAVPELQKIPLTKRGVSESFWALTAVTSDGRLSKDIFEAARTNATIIILMGMKKIKEIAEVFTAAGKSETLAAVIQNGSLPEEKIIVSKIEKISELIHDKNSPGIIIIGNVVSLHPEAKNIFQENFIKSN